jgi:hypothetical protein
MINKKTQLIQQKKTKTLSKKIIPKDKNLLHNKFLIIIRKILNICGNKKRKKNIIKGGAQPFSESLKSQINNFINNEMKKSMEYFTGLKYIKMKSIKYNSSKVIENLETTRKNLLDLITKDNPIFDENFYNNLNLHTTTTIKQYDDVGGPDNYNFYFSDPPITIDTNVYRFYSKVNSFNKTNSYFVKLSKDTEQYDKEELNYYYIFIDYLLFEITKKKNLNDENYIFKMFPDHVPTTGTNIYIYNGMIKYNIIKNNDKFFKGDYIHNMYMYEDQIYKQKIIINKIGEDELDLKNLNYLDINLLKVYGKDMNYLDSDIKNNILKNAAIINIGITLYYIKDIV